MVPLSHSEQVVSMFHQPLHLDWPWCMEFPLKLESGRSGPTPLQQLQHSSTAELQEPPGLCREASAKPAQPSAHRRSAWDGRDEQTLLPQQTNYRSLRNVPGRGVSQTGHREAPLERFPGSCRKTVPTPWTITTGSWVLLHLLPQTSPYCLHF